MPRMKMIVNPQSDRGVTGEKIPSLRGLIEQQAQVALQTGRSYELDWVMTERRGHAVDLAYQAAREGYDIVVAVGGDGTVHEIVNGLMQFGTGQCPLLGIIPVGSGNDFAHNFGLPGDPEAAARQLFEDKTRAVDLCTISDVSRRQEYWDNTLGIGFSGEVNLAARNKTRMRGFLVYFVTVLETILFKPLDLSVTIKINDQEPVQRLTTMMSICNGPREGGGFPVAPDAVMDDGLISYMFTRRLGRLQLLYFLPIVMSAKHLKYKRFFEAGTATRLRIESDRPMSIHADGEQFAEEKTNVRQVEITIIPAALRVLCNR